MKEKLLSLTQKLMNAGYQIEGIDVESRDMVRIKFKDIKGLELLVNGSLAMIEAGECQKGKLKQLKEILKADYKLVDDLEAFEEDIFTNLLNAS
jgi:hypothetical protein